MKSVHSPVSPSMIAPDLLMLAYRSGIFPMADSRDDPEIFWVEPRNRAILPLDGFHLSHSLGRTLRRGRFTITCNHAFAEVVEACAAPRAMDNGESWISRRIAESYQHLHRLGLAHSIECWRVAEDGTRVLAGGLYGVGFDRVFCGESMFSRTTDSSKIALAWLVAALIRSGAELLDCQFMTPHLASLGAVEISQKRYLALLSAAQRPYSDDAGGDEDAEGEGDSEGAGEGGGVLSLPDGFAALLAEAEASGCASSPGKFIAHFLTQTS